MQGLAADDLKIAEVEGTAPQNLINNSRLIRVNLSKIVGVHSAVASAYLELSIPPLRFPAKLANGDEQFRAVLSRTLIRVVREKGRLRCIGNVRTFLAMRAYFFSKDPEVTCVEVFRISAEKIRTDCVADYLYEPAIAGIHFSETRIICEVARRAAQAGLWTTKQPVENYIATLFDVDRRQLARKTAKTEVGHESAPLVDVQLEEECPIEMEVSAPSENTVESESESPNADLQVEMVTKQDNFPQNIYEIQLGGVKLGLFTPENSVALHKLLESVREITVLPAADPTEAAKNSLSVAPELLGDSEPRTKTQGAL